MPDFLLEIGIEEIPARMIDDARSELVRRMALIDALLQSVSNAETTADLPQLLGPTSTVSPVAGSMIVRACDM